MDNQKYFYCVVSPQGFVYIFYAAYYRGQAIEWFIEGNFYNGAPENWKEYYKKGYRCKKFELKGGNK